MLPVIRQSVSTETIKINGDDVDRRVTGDEERALRFGTEN